MPRPSTILFTIAAIIIVARYVMIPLQLRTDAQELVAGLIVFVGLLFAGAGALLRVASL